MRLKTQIDLAYQLASRLERLSVDSRLAHKASGLRGSLLRYLERVDRAGVNNIAWTEAEYKQLDRLIQGGYEIVEQAAKLL
jgi:hypothetical protein